MSWAWDAPSGVYKDHALSSDIRDAAVADSKFMRFLSPEKGYGKGRGASVTITRFGSLPLAGQVSESDLLPSSKPPVVTKQLSVAEWGHKVPLTEFEENLTHFDIRNRTQRALRDQMRLTMDKMAADALKTTVVKVASTSATVVAFDTDGVVDRTSTNNLTVAHLREIHDYLHGTLKCPPWKNGRFVGILSTKAARGLKNDTTYKDWWSPTDKTPIITGMLPSIENFDLFETNHFDALDNSIGASSVSGEAIFFGDDAGFLATVDEPELRAGPKTDLGRFSDVGWVGTIQAGLTWELAASSRAIHWASLTS